MLNRKTAQRSEVSDGKSRSPIAIAIPTARASEFRSKKHLWSVFCNTQYREIKLIRSPALDSEGRTFGCQGIHHPGWALGQSWRRGTPGGCKRCHAKTQESQSGPGKYNSDPDCHCKKIHPHCHCKTIFTLIVIAKLFLSWLSLQNLTWTTNEAGVSPGCTLAMMNTTFTFLKMIMSTVCIVIFWKMNFQTYFICWGKIISILSIDVQCHLFNSL